MATAIEAPHQYKQPSRKGKRAWRKHVDITEVDAGLQRVREEEIEGGVIAEKPSEDLFVLDSKGSDELQRKVKSTKPLKCDEILARRSAIPSVDSRKRGSSKVTDGILEPKSKRSRSDWVTHKEWMRLKQVAKNANIQEQDDDKRISHDPWDEDNTPEPAEQTKLNFLEKPKPIVVPPTTKLPSLSLAANGKPVPSIKKPDPGISYNPTFEDWDRLLTEEGQKEVDAEKKRLEEEKAEQERLARIEAAKDDSGEAQSDDESAWEGFESEYETPEWLKKKRPERKTRAQRNKIKRRKEAERKAKWEAKLKKREEQAAQVKAIAEAVAAKEEAAKQLQKAEDDSLVEGDDRFLRKRPFGKNPVPAKPLEVVLPDELQDSLRLLKPEGNLLGDRFRNLIVQGKLEARNPITQPKKAKRDYTEKWTYKDFIIKP
ncbi:60S ribosomal biogenesis protein Nop53 [Blastomyces gilchristii SLH14081]|uniref:Ribosome biogenesis protein NOP53 n=1 Tax=Blastomyces gilchristii (strain SLH14081) TaxID=559298 RepID=A0A179V582_BLAGS|nr:60S ribosome subunit biogenesis protein NOP53 [Blastomyces gilchristii SLH14081]OAT13792.1 60S ribosomal biogenesis protein Nop53 [Blastomyces gilchristii SLH14081]